VKEKAWENKDKFNEHERKIWILIYQKSLSMYLDNHILK